jgi:hypothetical protein
VTDPKSETANKAGYLLAVIIAAQLIVTAFGLALDYHCRSGGAKERCIIAADTATARAAGPAATLSPHR